MKIVFHRNALKFLEKVSLRESESIRSKLKVLVESYSNEGIIPFKELNIKYLTGEWQNFYRMRVGKIRIIFKIDKQEDSLFIYEIDFRGNVY